MTARARTGLSVALLIAGLLVLASGLLAAYANDRLVDGDAFADEAVATLDDPEMRRFVSTRLTARLIEDVDPDLVSVKPLIESAVGALLDSDALRSALRQGILVAHQAVFERSVDDAVIRAADFGALVRGVLIEIDPDVARRIPSGFDAGVVRLADSPAAVEVAQAAERIGRAAAILPALGILLVCGSALAAGDRRRAAVRAGTAVLTVAAVAVVALAVAREALIDRVDGDAARGAAEALWQEFVAPLGDWYAWMGGAGLLLILVATLSLSPADLGAPLRRAWSVLAREPSGPARRILWAVGLAIAGAALVVAAERLLRFALILAGIYLVGRALATGIAVPAQWTGWSLEEGGRRGGAARQGDRPGARRALAVAALAAALAAAAVGAGLSLLIGETETEAPAAEKSGRCNGSPALCDRRLDRVALLATHNSHTGTGYPGFLFPAQQGTIRSQLENGVRGLWIDTYYGVPGRRVYTLTDRIDPALNAQLSEEIGPRAERAAASIRADIARPPEDEEGRMYLCHGYCELGAVDAAEAFGQIAAFLDQNPEEVLVIDIEDYTTPADTVELIESSGLARHAYRGPQGPPWPTLGEMVASGERVLIVVEHRTDGAPSWYRRAYSLFQETPFGFKSPAEMSCRPNRGSPGNSLFVINHWISTDPAPKPSNAEIVNAYEFLLDRARRCQRARGLFPNVLNVDFYRSGDAARVVRTLNGGS